MVYIYENTQGRKRKMTEIKARYRNKLKKIIVEVWNGEKWLYVKTLLDPLTEFKAECLAKVSQNTPKNEEKEAQKFAYDRLGEQQKKDITIEDIKREQNKLMDEILKK